VESTTAEEEEATAAEAMAEEDWRDEKRGEDGRNGERRVQRAKLQ
jgi:hypothetical protein